MPTPLFLQPSCCHNIHIQYAQHFHHVAALTSTNILQSGLRMLSKEPSQVCTLQEHVAAVHVATMGGVGGRLAACHAPSRARCERERPGLRWSDTTPHCGVLWAVENGQVRGVCRRGLLCFALLARIVLRFGLCCWLVCQVAASDFFSDSRSLTHPVVHVLFVWVCLFVCACRGLLRLFVWSPGTWLRTEQTLPKRTAWTARTWMSAFDCCGSAVYISFVVQT